jgi:4'-phosphopantetheinyl transferase EntD
MIEQIVPPEVSCFATRGDDISAWLFPDEAAQMQGAVDTRLREFTTGRTCARLAVAKLGLSMAPILRGSWREPIWPRGVVGSITHCRGYRAAAVAMQKDILTVGIDAEPDEKLPPGVLEQVAVAREQAWLSTAPLGVHWDRLLFSAKECVFKAWFPLAHDWLGFDQAVVSFHPIECTFEVRLLVPLPAPFGGGPEFLTGRFLARDGLLLTAIVVPQRECEASTVR